MTQEVKMSAGATILLIIALASKKAGIIKFSEDGLYIIFKKLTEEFPAYFQELYFYFLPISRFPYCKGFEDILFRAASSGCLMRTGIRMNEFLLEKKMAQAIEKTMKKHYGEDALNKLETVVGRFIELIPKKNANISDLVKVAFCILNN